ncbi:phosphate ABC transporter substrate-binding protein PstS [Microbacterium sp. P07]|uniref:phosphate ABC transporter substrate-binding protein PstS n=1 Tax=Microbacterium sp. P07 TaxID=3366952 RepID=UPI0037468125
MIRRFTPTRLTAAFIGLTLIVLGVFGSLTPAQAVGVIHAPIVGSGSTWSANALQAWIRNVFANYQWTITYSESGSTQGRNDFKNGTADFGISEIPYAIGNSNEGDVRPNRGFAYMPVVAGGTAFMYNLEIGGRRVTNLRLSGETLTKIFTNQIKVWNDPAIAADNPQLALPATPIVPVVRSDGSGTSAQFSLWMRETQTALWDAYCGVVGRPLVNGHCGVTSNYPVAQGSGFVARSGANGVAGYVAQSHAVGAITFVEYSYALNAKYPVVKMLNAAGYYTEPTAANVAVALLSARINEDSNSLDYLTQDLTQVYGSPDSRTYPLSSYSYIILPTDMQANFTEDKGLTLADFSSYFLCEGQQSAEVLGYSPLPINLVTRGYQQVLKVPGGNPAVKDPVGDCNNPTFSPDGTNRLANEAPFPPECDKQGPTQCAKGTGGAQDQETPASGDSAGAAAAAASGPAAGGGAAGAAEQVAGAAGAGAAAGSTPDGATVAADAAPLLTNATPQTLPVSQSGMLPGLAMLGAGGGLLAAAVVPPLLGRRARRPVFAPTPTPGGTR